MNPRDQICRESDGLGCTGLIGCCLIVAIAAALIGLGCLIGNSL